MIQTTKKVLPDKPGIYIVSVVGQVYGVLFVQMHDGLQYKFASYLERKPEFRPYDAKDHINEWDEFWLIGDEMGILDNAEEAKRVLDRSIEGSVKHDVQEVTEWYDEKIAQGETPTIVPSRVHEDDLVGRTLGWDTDFPVLFPQTLRFWLDPQAKERDITPFQAPKDGDAGYDLRAIHDSIIPAGKFDKIYTGLHLEIPTGYVGIIKDRSSMASMGITTHGGVIDSSYRGEIIVLLKNNTEADIELPMNYKVAQLVIVPIYDQPVEQCETLEELSSTSRGSGGFGSTGMM